MLDDGQIRPIVEDLHSIRLIFTETYVSFESGFDRIITCLGMTRISPPPSPIKGIGIIP